MAAQGGRGVEYGVRIGSDASGLLWRGMGWRGMGWRGMGWRGMGWGVMGRRVYAQRGAARVGRYRNINGHRLACPSRPAWCPS